MATLIISGRDFKKLLKHVEKKTEQVAFLFCAPTSEESLSAKEVYLVPAKGLLHESEYHSELTDEELSKVIKRAAQNHYALCEVHSHPSSGAQTKFSSSDKSGFAEFVPHIWWRLNGKPYLAIVIGEGFFDGLAWIKGPNHPEPIDFVKVGGKELRPTGITYRELLSRELEENRYSRQEAFFGKAGQNKIGKLRIAIVGVGGIGSHITQQLAYLGIRKFVLVDHDRVDGTNLNRLVGATAKDLGEHKIDVAKRLIESVQTGSDIKRIPEGLFSRAALDEIQKSDFVFGCVDEDGVRAALLEVCCVFKKPYIDLATDVSDETAFGGRVIFTGIGKGCPKCREELDDEEIDWYFSSPEQRKERERIYGVRKRALGDSGPSVIFLNGIVASVGVQEFATYVNLTLRQPIPFLVYRGNMGILTKPTEAPRPDCYYCHTLWNGKLKSDIYRFAKS
jgi:ThiF family